MEYRSGGVGTLQACATGLLEEGETELGTGDYPTSILRPSREIQEQCQDARIQIHW